MNFSARVNCNSFFLLSQGADMRKILSAFFSSFIHFIFDLVTQWISDDSFNKEIGKWSNCEAGWKDVWEKKRNVKCTVKTSFLPFLIFFSLIHPGVHEMKLNLLSSSLFLLGFMFFLSSFLSFWEYVGWSKCKQIIRKQRISNEHQIKYSGECSKRRKLN